MVQWQYKFFGNRGSDEDRAVITAQITKFLDEMGKEGWEVYTQKLDIRQFPKTNYNYYTWEIQCWAKRPLERGPYR